MNNKLGREIYFNDSERVHRSDTLGKVRYMVIWVQFIDLYDTPFDDETPYPKKYGLFHNLSWNVTKNLSLGLF